MGKKNATRIDVITDGFIDSIVSLVSLSITFCLSEHGPVASVQLLEAVMKSMNAQLDELRGMQTAYEQQQAIAKTKG